MLLASYTYKIANEELTESVEYRDEGEIHNDILIALYEKYVDSPAAIAGKRSFKEGYSFFAQALLDNGIDNNIEVTFGNMSEISSSLKLKSFL
ncbi:hypothetical protein SME22J_20510 [Serratia marcescens]|nr:hypothetical protein SME22J_20510 [Serratia marcescens]